MTPSTRKSFSAVTVVFAACALISSLLTSCSTTRYNMMNPYLDSTKDLTLKAYPFTYDEPVIKVYDMVRVRFAGMNPTTTAMLNSYGGVEFESKLESSESTSTAISGQQVDKDGFLDFPLIGKVKAAGLTRAQLREDLLKAVAPLLKDPFVLVDLPKRGITIVGSAKKPSTVVFPKERANLFEIMAQVGYLDEFGDFSKVKVYRENADGSRVLAHLNLEDTAFLNSPYFYPKPDDIVYIPTRAARRISEIGQTYAQFATILLALTSLVVSFTK